MGTRSDPAGLDEEGIRSADTQWFVQPDSLKPVSVQRYCEMRCLWWEFGNYVWAEPPRISKIRVFAALLSRDMPQWSPNQKGLVGRKIVGRVTRCCAPTGSR